MAGRLLSIISFPILTRMLTPESYGIAALAATIINIFAVIGVCGQDTAYVFSYNDTQNFPREEVDRFYSRYGWLVGAVLGLAGLGAWFIIAFFTLSHASPWVGLLVAVGVAGSIISTFAQVRARLLDRYGILAIAQLGSGAVSTAICIAAAWLWRRDEVALLLTVTSYWALALMLPALRLKEMLQASQLTRAQIRKMVIVGIPLVVNALAYWVISSSDRWFLAVYSSKYQVGIYSVGITIASLGQMVTSALGSVWNPEIFRHYHNGELTNKDQFSRTLTVMIWLTVTTCFGIVLFGDLMIRILAGPAFQDASAYVAPIALGYMFYGINQLIGFGFVMSRKSNIFPLIWGAGLAVSLVLNAILIPRMGGTGAAIVQCLTYGSVVLITWSVGRPYTPIQPAWWSLFTAAGLYLAVILLNHAVMPQTGILLAILVRAALAFVTASLTLLVVLRSFGPLSELPIPWLLNKIREDKTQKSKVI